MKRVFHSWLVACLTAFVLLVTGCLSDPVSDNFVKPTVTAYYSNVSFGEVKLKCRISNANFKECGFWYGTSPGLSDKKTLRVTSMDGLSGEAVLSNLEPGKTYYFQAFADGGRNVATSDIGSFTISNVMDVDATGFQLTYAETDIQVTVETNLSLKVDLGGASWIKETKTKGLETYHKVFHISRNSELTSRKATIKISSTDGEFTKEIPVEQGGGPIDIPDKVFKAYMVENFDKDGDGEIIVTEAEAIERIDIETDDIASLKGIEYCSRLKFLKCVGTDGSGRYGSGKLAYVDVTHCPELEELIVYHNVLTELDVTQCPKLSNLHPARNFIVSLDLSHCPNLNHLGADFNLMKEIDLSKNTHLTRVDVSENQVTHIDASKCVELRDLIAYNTQLEQVDVSGCSELRELRVQNNQLTELDISRCPELQKLSFNDNNIKTIDLSNNRKIQDFSSYGNPLEQLPDLIGCPLTSLHMPWQVDNIPSDYFRNFPDLEYLNFDGYKGASIDLSLNTKLVWLACSDLRLSTLDVSAAPGLKTLYCKTWSTQNLKAVYVHTGVVFETLEKNDDTQIYYTDGNNHLNISPSKFEIDYKENVIVVNIDADIDVTSEMGDVTWITPTTIPGQSANSLCFKVAQNNSTESRTASFLIRTGNGQLNRDVTVIQGGGPIDIPDAAFKAYMVANFDKDGDGEITPQEAEAIEDINISTDDIVSLKGIEYCSHLKWLSCFGTDDSNESGSGKLSYVDVTHCPELERISLFQNVLTQLDVSQCPKLRELWLNRNLLSSLDVTHNSNLEYLNAEVNLLREIDVSKNTRLRGLWLSVNKIKQLDISNCVELEVLVMWDNDALEQLDISRCPNLSCLNVQNNKLKFIDLSHNPKIIDLNINNNPFEQLPDFWSLQLTALHVSNVTQGLSADFLTHFPDLESVNFGDYDGTTIDLSKNTKLRDVWCGGLSNMKVLDLSAATGLKNLYCRWSDKLNTVYVHTGVSFDTLEKDDHTQIYYTDGNNHLNISPSSFEVDYKETIIAVTVDSDIDVTSDMGSVSWITPTTIPGQSANTLYYKVARNTSTDSRSASFIIRTGNGLLEKSVTVTQGGGPIGIPDAAFKAYMVEHFDKDGDGEIIVSEAEDIGWIDIISDQISSLKGIEYCKNLVFLKCEPDGSSETGILSEVDVTKCTKLEEVYFYRNKLPSLDVSHCPNLRRLSLGDNQISSIDLSKCPELQYIWIHGNQLKKLDLSKSPKMIEIHTSNNQLTALDVSIHPNLERINVSDNKLTRFDLSKCTKLQYLWISNNQIKSLDVSMLPELLVLDVGDNQLTSIDISSNPKITELFLQGNQIKQLPDIWSLTLTSLHLSGMVSGLPSDFLTHFPELTSVNFSGYDGTTIDLSQNTKLMDVWCWDLSQMPTLDLSAAPKLRSLYCGSWSKTLQTVYIHKNASLETLEKDDNTKIVKK